MNDRFWRLEGAEEIITPIQFFALLKEKDRLQMCVYRPDELAPIGGRRTAKIVGKIFERISFAKTSIKSIIFSECEFRDCLFIGGAFDSCEFHSCRFVNSNTYKILITKTYLDPLSFKECFDKKAHQNVGVQLYQELLNNSRDEEQIEFERDAQFFFLRWKRYQTIYEAKKIWVDPNKTHRVREWRRKYLTYLRRLVWEKFFGSGIRLRYFLGTVVTTIFTATLINYTFSAHFGLLIDGQPINTLSEAFYFSTVSLTTLGYGDITPTTKFGQVAASVQSVFGFSLFAILASMLVRRVTP